MRASSIICATAVYGGVLLWNVWEQVDAARGLIAEAGPFRPADLKGRLPA